jgi:hypothetical protein
LFAGPLVLFALASTFIFSSASAEDNFGFLGEVASDRSAGAWRFSPAAIDAEHHAIP